MDRFYITRTGCAGYWGEEFHIMERGKVIATALSLESARKKLIVAQAAAVAWG